MVLVVYMVVSEREGFSYRYFLQVTVKPTISDSNSVNAAFEHIRNFGYSFYSFSYSLYFRENGISRYQSSETGH